MCASVSRRAGKAGAHEAVSVLGGGAGPAASLGRFSCEELERLLSVEGGNCKLSLPVVQLQEVSCASLISFSLAAGLEHPDKVIRFESLEITVKAHVSTHSRYH